ncbi:fimbrial protein [Escherichia coli]
MVQPSNLEIQCDGNTAPSIEVLASEFDANNFTLNKGTAENIGFAIFLDDRDFDQNRAQGKNTLLKDNGSGQYFLNLNAQYARTSGNPVTKGSVESTVTIKIRLQVNVFAGSSATGIIYGVIT